MGKRRRFKRLEAENQPRFLTFTCYQRLRLLGTSKIRDHFMTHLSAALDRHPVKILAWVVMPDHVHLVLLPKGNAAITRFLIGFKRPFAQSVLSRWSELSAPILARLERPDGTHRFWQTGGGFDRILFGNELFEKIAYCHENPIRRNLVASSTAWRWSSAAQYAGLEGAGGPPIDFSLLPPADRPLW